jgi:H+-translocating NAD(P) transhydrogenase subunit alpha
MKIGIPKEIAPGERRVAGTAETVKRLIEQGFSVVVESGAGMGANCSDSDYEREGATISLDASPVWDEADIVLKVQAPMLDEDRGFHEGDRLRQGVLLVCLLHPAQNKGLLERMGAHGGSVLALDQIPRISRAQKMDVLSSMANIAGYRAIIEASHAYGGFFGGQITAAGRTRPAQVLVIGAGVAGLAAIATARGLGAEVRAFDVRPAVKEQVESLGARFLPLDLPEESGGETAGGYAKVMSKAFIEAEMTLFRQQAKEVDVIVTTALIPGKKAPVLITKDMVESMQSGSVVVDLAAGQGGNCEYSEADKVVDVGGVSVIGYTDLTSRLARHASKFFGTNLTHLLDDLGKAENFRLDLGDEVVRKSLVLMDGELIWPPPPDPTPKTPAPAPPPPVEAPIDAAVAGESKPSSSGVLRRLGVLALVVGLALLGLYAPAEFIQHLTVFVLACFVGWQVVWSVTPALHTPLMSVTNAISGIIVIGGMLQAATGTLDVASVLGAVAILVASINVVGGFYVTQRMLQMFHREGS